MTRPVPPALIQRALAITQTQHELAVRLEMTKARMTQIVRGARLNVENCLRLARLLNEDPVVVFRAYGYAQLADILQTLYTARGDVPPRHARIYEALERLQPEDCPFVESVIKRLADPASAPEPTSTSFNLDAARNVLLRLDDGLQGLAIQRRRDADECLNDPSVDVVIKLLRVAASEFAMLLAPKGGAR